MATCTCSSIDCTQSTIEGVVYCTCQTILSDITCPPGCEILIQEDGNAKCSCVEQVEPIITQIKTPISFDNSNHFKDVSFTISFKPTEGTWNSFFTFYPDYSISHNGFFQVGYNWGEDKESVWNHLLNNSSFSVFQGKKHVPSIEFPIVNENTYKMLNSISLNIEGVHTTNDWDVSYDKNMSFKNLFIYNQTNCSGMLGLNPQKSLTDNRKYPITNGNTQEILFTSDGGNQNINYFFNRTINQENNTPLLLRDENNIFKTINSNAVKFYGKKVLERLKGDWFIIHLEGNPDSRFNIVLKNTINNETVDI